MNFYECSKKLTELYNKIRSNEYLENETYETIEVELNEVFFNTIKTSINENIYFSASPLDLFIIELEKRMEINQKSEIDFDDIEYIKEVYLFTTKILTAERYWKQDNDYFYLPQLNRKNLILLRSILKKRTEYLEKLLYKKGIEIVVKYPNGDHSIVKRTFKKNINIMVENDNFKLIKPTKENVIKWHGTQTEFIELIKALIENGNIKGTQSEIINKLSSVFNIEINHPNKLINDLKKRNNDSETLFLDKLKKSLFDYITLEKKK